MMPIVGPSQLRGARRYRSDDSGLREKAPAAKRHSAAAESPRRRRRIIFNGRQPEPLPSYFGTVEDPEKGKLGVCCSGGGIRSAAFSLGALQALQKKKELPKASYLAAVSGGSYIAAAISMVAKKGDEDSDPDLIDDMPAFAPGSPEEQYLRNRCSYLAPTTLDKVYLGMRVVLGLLVNLVFVSLPLIGLALILTGLLYAPHLPGLVGSAPFGDYRADLPLGFWVTPLALLALSVLAGLGTLLVRWRKEEWERFFVSWATRLLLVAGFAALFFVAVPWLVEWLRDVSDAGKSAGSVVDANAPKLGLTTLGLLAGIAAQLGHFFRSKPAAEGLERGKKALGKLGSAARLAIAYAAGALAGPLLLVLVYALTVAMSLAELSRPSEGIAWGLVGIGLGVLAGFALLYAFADLTTWSLHPFYKRRLSTAFALKRVKAEQLTPKERRRLEVVDPSPRGVAVERDFDELVPISETALEVSKDSSWPTLLVCAAANISDTAATPPGRAVTSFTFSANTAGGPLVGAIEMSELEGAFEKVGRRMGVAEAEEPDDDGITERLTDLVTARKHRRHDLSLPAAVAMSGAAISPSMGKMTARPLRFLMALANVRLGVWIPNPRWVAADGEKPVPTRPRPFYLLRELLGWNSVGAKYLYVTDGGHYENLGLVELLRRGCTDVYCLDASGVNGDGAEFGALGEAIALARSELGVEIEFKAGKLAEDLTQLTPDAKTHLAARDVVTGTISYPPAPDGTAGPQGRLIYVRNTMTGDAPWDVRSHHESDPRFPNNPTVDQLYTDQKFEAYRVLGERAGVSAYEALRKSRAGAYDCRMALLREEEIEAKLAGLDGWQRKGDAIAKEYACGDFVGSVKFVSSVVEPAEAMGHHPDLEISWDTVTVTISTHSEGGLTGADFELAEKVDALSPMS
jgi:pterin-4a-carbinolamine dehydratase